MFCLFVFAITSEWKDRLFDFMSSNGVLFNTIMLIIALLSIGLSVYFYFHPRKKRAPTYRTRSTRLIQNKIKDIDKLDILFDGQKLSSLTTSKVAFWNDGRETLSHSDLSHIDSLRIEINPKYEILSCEMLIQTKVANDFKIILSADKKSALIDFDFVDYKEGVVFRVRHTGTSNSDICLLGSIKAVDGIKRTGFHEKPTKRSKWAARALRVFLSVFSVLFCVVCAVLSSSQSFVAQMNKLSEENTVLITVLFILMAVSIVIQYMPSIRKLVPKSLEVVFMNDDF